MKNYLNNWNLPRIIRLVFGIILTIQGIQLNEWMLVVFGGLFMLMPLFNFGCCSTSACSTKHRSIEAAKTDDINYEEVK